MIDIKQELQDYNIINLKDLSQNESDMPDNMRNSVFLYNKAIESLRNGSEDIAIIELKKAISMNSHFYEAMNLLGLCYSYIKENAKAAEVFEKVVKAEQNSVKALRYLSLLNTDETTSKNTKKPFWQEGLKYLAFFAAGILVFLLVQTLTVKPVENENIQDTTQNLTAKDAEDEFKLKYEELLPKYDLLQKGKDEAIEAVDYYKSVIKLYEIERLIAKKQYTAAAEILLLMKKLDFEGEDKVKFDELYTMVMPKAARAIYDEGYKLYNTKKYSDSLKKFEKVELYDNEFSRLDAVFYYMGKSYQLLNDSRNAIALYQKLITAFPKSSYALNAKTRLKSLTRQP